MRSVAIAEHEREAALDAYAQFDEGRHPARLNMGDCFAYAVTKTRDAAMLHKDDGFYRTDIKSALARA